MIVLGINSGYHDGSATLFDEYRPVAAISLERLTRRKGDGGARIPEECIDEVLRIAGLARRDVDIVCVARTALPLPYFKHFRGGRWLEQQWRLVSGRRKPKDMTIELRRAGSTDAGAIFDGKRFLADLGFGEGAELFFYNHHFAHALPTLFFTDWDDALLYTADGRGDNVHYSHRIFKHGRIESLFGDDRWLLPEPRTDSLGLVYGWCTQALGYKINRHEGKLTGLAAWGKPVLYERMAARFAVDDSGVVSSDFATTPEMRAWVIAQCKGVEPADVAASAQKLLEETVLASVARIVASHGVRRLGLSGGVFANVRLNRLLAECAGVDEIFVFPAMSDEGLPVGGALEYLLRRDGLAAWLAQRRRLDDVYLGPAHDDRVDGVLAALPGVAAVPGSPAATAAALIAAGRIGAIYAGRMEFGPRALGARSILASPADAEVNRTLNDRLERTEFMPFAPVVAEHRAREVFDIGPANAYACRFMTVTTGVKAAWRARIPAVVHIDGSARPQTARRDDNPLYFDILAEFERRTGLPVLVNTSFNVHEEPIVNRPEECARALADGRVDFVVTRGGVFARS